MPVAQSVNYSYVSTDPGRGFVAKGVLSWSAIKVAHWQTDNPSGTGAGTHFPGEHRPTLEQ